MSTMGELPTRSKDRLAHAKELYIDGELTDEQFERLLDGIFDEGPPYHRDWFKRQPGTRHKQYTEEAVYLYHGEEYTIDGMFAVLLDGEIDRTIDVTA